MQFAHPAIDYRSNCTGAKSFHDGPREGMRLRALHGLLIPFCHRLMRTQTINIELTPVY